MDLIEELRPNVVAMIDREWGAILAMAVTLEDHGNLSGGILEAALRGIESTDTPHP